MKHNVLFSNILRIDFFAMLFAQMRELKITTISASRPICIECQELIEQNDIKTNTPFSGEKSKKSK